MTGDSTLVVISATVKGHSYLVGPVVDRLWVVDLLAQAVDHFGRGPTCALKNNRDRVMFIEDAIGGFTFAIQPGFSSIQFNSV